MMMVVAASSARAGMVVMMLVQRRQRLGFRLELCFPLGVQLGAILAVGFVQRGFTPAGNLIDFVFVAREVVVERRSHFL